MKNISKPIYYCKSCNKELASSYKICPYCGNDKRLIKLTISETIEFRSSLIARKFPQGFRNWVLEIISGWFPGGDTTKHPDGVKKTRLINRENPKNMDSYQEKVIDFKTGKITRNIKEPLEKHKHK